MAKLRLSNGRLRGTSRPRLTVNPAGYTPVEPATVLTLTAIPDLTLYQRPAGVTRLLDVVGTCSGPCFVQARVLDADTGAVVVDWYTVARPTSAGAYAGQIPVPSGGWYIRQVRDAAGIAYKAADAQKFGNGLRVVSGGQSNHANQPSSEKYRPLGHPKALEHSRSAGVTRRIGNISLRPSVYGPNVGYSGAGYSGGYSVLNTDYAASGSRGDGHVLFANALADGLGIPVCVENVAEIGSSIDQWMSVANGGNGVLWQRVIDAVARGNGAEVFVLRQGEAHAVAGTSIAAMKSKLTTLRQQWLDLIAQYGRDASNSHFIVMALGPGSGIYAGVGRIRQAIAEWAKEPGRPDVSLVCAHDTSTASDVIHIDTLSHAKVALREAKTLLKRLGVANTGRGGSGAGPHIANATLTGNVMTVNVTHAGGNALQDGTGSATGAALGTLEVLADGAALTYTSQITGPSQFQLTLSATPAAGAVVTLSNALADIPCGAVSGNAITFVPSSCLYDNDALYAWPGLSGMTLGSPLQPCGPITVTRV